MEDNYTLQSHVFGHRFKANQTIYEYILEFLLVVLADKEISEADGGKTNEFFPLGVDVNSGILYHPNNYVALKRFIFFNKSKQEGKFKLDEAAYKEHVEYIKEKIDISDRGDDLDKDYYVNLLQNLLYGFSAVVENRSWFAQSMLPICPQVITSEIMGMKSNRNEVKYEEDGTFSEKVDSDFQTNRYNFMSRGGEVYYLHVLSAVNNHQEYKKDLEEGIKNIIHQFKAFEYICDEIQKTWVQKTDLEESHENQLNELYPYQSKGSKINKTLGKIPHGFKQREEYTLKELINILHSEMHPFEKLEVLSQGIIVQIITMCYLQAQEILQEEKSYLVYDVNCYKGKSNEEIRKFANLNYIEYEQSILDALYSKVHLYKNKTKKKDEEGNIIYKSELATINDAKEDSIKLFKKLGKKIGIIRPINEKSIRFTLNETVLKFFVISIVKPGTKMTFDSFLEKLYKHFKIVIGKEQLIEADKSYENSNLAFLEENKREFQEMLKESGFLRELSDSTAIVENPYLEV